MELGFDYEVLTRPRRRYPAIQITEHCEVKVLIPKGFSVEKAHDFLHEKSQWVSKVLQKQEKRRPKERVFENGAVFSYLGRALVLRCIAPSNGLNEDMPAMPVLNEEMPVRILGEQLLVLGEGESIKGRLETWYRDRAVEIIEDRVGLYAEEMGLMVGDVRIKSLKSRWGSCSSKGNVNFNWTLVMAPLEVLDYVVVHELAHLRHMNHSPAFWGLVAQYCEDYKTLRSWLKRNGHVLSWL